jgi:serine/threonine protein kinase/Tol biopolymer transport system component
LTGRTLLHYHILEKIGEGGMGIVYKARDTHLDRFVALKLLLPDKVSDPERRARFVREAKAASALRHPGIVTIHDIACDSGHDVIVMEYVAGKTLDQLIGRTGLRVNDAIKYAIQIADALARAHEAGILHRDLKPSNIIVDQRGIVRIVDFGLAKLIEEPSGEDAPTISISAKTQEGIIVGTAAYMSPEQAQGNVVDARSDVFSFGAVLYEMVSGRRAFIGKTTASTLAAILEHDPPTLDEHVPRELQRVIARCLRKDTSHRWHSMSDVKFALEDIREDSELDQLAAVQAPPPRRSWRAAAGLALLGLTVVMLWLSRQWHTSAPGVQVWQPKPLTTYEGEQLMPTFSPDGNEVAFSWCKEEACAIYIKQIGVVEEPSRLSKQPDNAIWPRWSPDGAYVAFIRIADGPDRLMQYVVVPQRGGPEHTIAEFRIPQTSRLVGLPGGIAWTPDSRNLVVAGASEERGKTALYAVPLRGGSIKMLVTAPENMGDSDPAISSDGRQLAFTRIRSVLQSDIYVAGFSADTLTVGAPVRLNTKPGAANFGPAWIPNTTALVYSTALSESMELHRVNAVANAVPEVVPVPDSAASWPALSPGGWLAYARTIGGDSDIYRTKSNGQSWSAPQKFVSSTVSDFEPRFSPDGKTIALSSARAGPVQIWLFDSDGTNPRALGPDSLHGQARARWSRDGTSILFWAASGNNLDIYTIDAKGTNLRRVTDDPARDFNPEWSCDAKYIYFNSDRQASVGAWRVSAVGGQAERKAEIGTETSDCKSLVYLTGWPDHAALWTKPVGGGEPELLVESLYPQSTHEVFPDGVYYVSGNRSSKGYPIMYKPFGSESARQLAAVQSPFWGLTVSPDRQTILFAAKERPKSNLMLVEGFR